MQTCFRSMTYDIIPPPKCTHPKTMTIRMVIQVRLLHRRTSIEPKADIKSSRPSIRTISWRNPSLMSGFRGHLLMWCSERSKRARSSSPKYQRPNSKCHKGEAEYVLGEWPKVNKFKKLVEPLAVIILLLSSCLLSMGS
jgi:hypothetical protein